jgi:glycosyltransferase involved in cell wall biosynthesis
VAHPRHPLTGVGVYSREILSGLAHAHPDVRFRWCYRAHRFRLGAGETKPANAHAWPLVDRWPPSCDLFHGLNQRLPRKRARRAVCTFHDLFVMTSDQYSSPEFRARFTQQASEAAQNCDFAIAVSAFTARQVESLLGIDPSRIRVVHHGVEAPFPAASERKPFILTVGGLQRRKNTARLVEAFEQIDAPDWRLTIAGSPGYGAEEIAARIESSPKRSLIDLPGFVTDAQRTRLYREASIFAFPSLDEGFGMPVLEAMSHATPVVASTSSSLPEVAGNAALFAHPLDAGALAQALQRLVDDAALRRELGAKGVVHASQFTWADAVRRTWAAYEELLSS